MTTSVVFMKNKGAYNNYWLGLFILISLIYFFIFDCILGEIIIATFQYMIKYQFSKHLPGQIS